MIIHAQLIFFTYLFKRRISCSYIKRNIPFFCLPSLLISYFFLINTHDIILPATFQRKKERCTRKWIYGVTMHFVKSAARDFLTNLLHYLTYSHPQKYYPVNPIITWVERMKDISSLQWRWSLLSPWVAINFLCLCGCRFQSLSSCKKRGPTTPCLLPLTSHFSTCHS